MSTTSDSNARLLKILQATPEQAKAIDRILAGQNVPAPDRPATTGPLLLTVTQAARLLGVSRHSVWRMARAGRFEKVEFLPGSFRVRRADIEMIAASRGKS